MAIYFEKAGKENTEKTLEVVYQTFKERGIRDIVVASTTGYTGMMAAERFQGEEANLVIVTHNYGFKKEGEIEIEEHTKRKIEELGGKVFTGTMVLRNLGTAVKNTLGFSLQDLVANTLRLFGQGMKVCVEIVCMATDAGLITEKEVIAVAGTGRGADTAVIVIPASSNNFFNVKIKEIIAKPKEW